MAVHQAMTRDDPNVRELIVFAFRFDDWVALAAELQRRLVCDYRLHTPEAVALVSEFMALARGTLH